MIKRFTIIAIIASMLMSLTACQKSTELMIVGKWLVDDVGTYNAQKGAFWEFNGSGGVTFHLSPNADKKGVVKGEWKVKKTMHRRHIEIKIVATVGEIDPTVQVDMSGTWRIDFLNNQEMGIVRIACPTCATEGTSYIRRDFTKIK